MPTNTDVGRAIRRLRRDRDLTIEALAYAADVHPTYVSGIERGACNPTWAIVTRIARALEVTIGAVVQAAEDEAEIARAVRDTRARLAVDPLGSSG